MWFTATDIFTCEEGRKAEREKNFENEEGAEVKNRKKKDGTRRESQ